MTQTGTGSASAGPDSLEARRWDLLVIGAGTAGIVGAQTAASLGASVLLVERERTGGDCLWTGCVPSKAFLAAAAAARDARAADRYGVHVRDVRVDFGEVMRHVRSAVAQIAPTDSPAALSEAGVRVVRANATLTGRSTADLDGHPVSFRQALLATGARPRLPDIAGLATARVFTSDTIWELRHLPRRLAILGGGPIGCELGQGFARLGSQVTIVEGAVRILPREDPDAADVVATHLRDDGVRLLTGATVVMVEADPTGTGGTVTTADGTTIDYDAILVAVGRVPRTETLGLDHAGVAVDQRGYVVVDRHLRTSNRRVWAAGDLTAHSRFTHTAGTHASVAAANAILGLRRTVQTATIPRVTFTHPELAAIGVDSVTAQTHTRLRVLTWQHSHVDRAVTETATAGLTRLVIDARSRIVGATIVSPRAGESLAELGLAIRNGMGTSDIAGSVHAYPTFSDGAWNAAIAEVRARLAAPRTARLIRILAVLRRGWLALRARRR